MAASKGFKPQSLAAHCARDEVAPMAWTTGTSRRASAGTSQPAARSSSAQASPALEPPVASTVVISASTRPATKSRAGTSPCSFGRSE